MITLTGTFKHSLPEVIFKLDKGIDSGSSVLNLLDELEKKRNAKEI